MPLIHFGFGHYHRSSQHQEQVEAFLDYILIPKKLRASVCPEFMPIINKKGAMWGNPNSAEVVDGNGIKFNKWVSSPPVGLLPADVPMVSFVDLPINKLRNWVPSEHYGKLGVAFTNQFRSRYKIKKVYYYNYPELENDPMVIQLNRAISKGDEMERERLSKEVVRFRKPAFLWPEINNLFAVIKMNTMPGGGMSFEKLTYSRYQEGYDFRSEQEARLITPEDSMDVPFLESDILAIIVPNSSTKELIEAKLRKSWANIPKVLEYPV